MGQGGKLARHAAERLVRGGWEIGQVRGEESPRGLIREEVAKLDDEFFHHLRDRDDCRHRILPP